MGPSERAMPEIQRSIGAVAGRMRRTTSLRSWSDEDLRQEIWRRLVERWDGYDPARGSEPAFAQVVIVSVALTLVREARALKRSLSLTSFTDLGDAVQAIAPVGDCDRVDARLDVEALVDMLDDPELREVCLLLSRDGPTQVARQTGRSRSVVYRCVQRTRERAKKEGFEC